MVKRNANFLIPLVCLITSMTGCATVSEPGAVPTGEELRHENLDVLFATEFPVSSIDEALQIASQSLAAGDIDKAIFFYVRALQFDVTNVELLTHIGSIHMRRGDTAKAKHAFASAKKYDPEFAPALEALGLIYMEEGHDQEAMTEFTLAIAVDERRWRAHNALGVYADKAGDYDIAQTHYRTALAINPDAAHVLANIGYSQFLAGDIDAAIADLYSAAHDRGFEAAWGNLAVVYAHQGYYQEAVVAFGKVMSDANAYNATGKIAIENGDPQHAYALLSEAISRSSTYFPEAEEYLRKLEAGGVTVGPIPIADMQ